MLIYNKITRYESLPFNEYLKLPGISHSFLKQQKNGITPVFNMTDNIRLGSLVDSIITEPKAANFNHSLYKPAKNIAGALTSNFGSLINNFKKQISFTAEIEFEGLIMPTKGRPDFLLEGHAVIDLKITQAKNIKALIEYMGYMNQLWHYSRLAGVNKAYIMIHSVPLNKTFVEPINVTGRNTFWEDHILNFGKILAV
jgi:hypothetical protein